MLAKLLNLPPVAAGVIVLFAAMPTGANAYIFAVQYQRLVNPVSGAVALGTLLAAVTLPRGGGGECGGGEAALVSVRVCRCVLNAAQVHRRALNENITSVSSSSCSPHQPQEPAELLIVQIALPKIDELANYLTRLPAS